MHISDISFYRLHRAEEDRVTRALEQHRLAAERVTDLREHRRNDEGLGGGKAAESKARWKSLWTMPARGEIGKLCKETFIGQTPFKVHPPASPAGKAAAALFLVVVAFQVALAAGAPWGEASFGGSNPGVLPASLRTNSAIAVVVYVLLAAVAGTRWTGATLRRRLLYGAAALMVIGTVVNVASPSFLERIVWTPVTIALVIALWRAARHASLSNVSRNEGGIAHRAV